METDAMNPQAIDTAFYLYAFVDPDVDVDGLPAVDGHGEVRVVVAGDVACAMSAVRADEYQRLAEAAAAPIDWIAPRAWRHHEILTALHARGSVVPLKFGTLCATLDGIQAILARLQAPIATLLDEFRGRDEWTLRTLVDEAALSARLQETDAGLLALRHDLGACSDGRAYFVRKQIEQSTDRLVTRHIASLQASVCERLAAAGWPTAAAPGSRRHGIASADVSLLVERSAFEQVESLVQALESDPAACHVAFELVGPWPPYSFTGTLSVGSAESDCDR